MDIFMLVFVIILSLSWLPILMATMAIFEKKGYHSGWMIVPAFIFGPLALLVALIMPIDQEGREEMRRVKEAQLKRFEEYQAKAAIQKDVAALKNGPKNSDTVSIISGVALVFGPILMVLFQSSDLAGIFALASAAGFIGLVVSNLPMKAQQY